MSDMMFALIGLICGSILGLAGYFIGRSLAKKQRGLDERHENIQTKAMARSWLITLIASYILFFLVIIKLIISPAMVLGTLMMIQMISWTICIAYSSNELKSEVKTDVRI